MDPARADWHQICRAGFNSRRWRIEPQRIPKSDEPPSPHVNSGEPQFSQKCCNRLRPVSPVLA